MAEFQRDNFVIIQGWMLTDLKLSGNELIIYAIIYGFTQDNEHYYTGSLKYMQSATNLSKNACMSILKRLTEKSLIIKESYMFNNVTFTKYKTDVSHVSSQVVQYNLGGGAVSDNKVVQFVDQGGAVSVPNNNIYNNTLKKDKDNNSETLFSEPIKQVSSVKKQSEEAEYKSRLMTEAGVSEEAVNEYIVLRKRKKASLGKIAATRLIKEIKKCPLPPDEIIGKCLERGWVGFEASWLMPKPQNNNFGGNNNGGSFDVNNPGFQTNR